MRKIHVSISIYFLKDWVFQINSTWLLNREGSFGRTDALCDNKSNGLDIESVHFFQVFVSKEKEMTWAC